MVVSGVPVSSSRLNISVPQITQRFCLGGDTYLTSENSLFEPSPRYHDRLFVLLTVSLRKPTVVLRTVYSPHYILITHKHPVLLHAIRAADAASSIVAALPGSFPHEDIVRICSSFRIVWTKY
jgi:hypothetical protein